MKTALSLLAILVACQIQAAVIPLTASRSVSVTGVAGGLDGNQTYSYSQHSRASSANFNGDVSGSASWTDTTPWYPGLQPGSYQVESRAIQKSSITMNQISVSGSVRGSGIVSMQGPYLGATSSAKSIFEVSFAVFSTTDAHLSLDISTFYHDLPYPHVDFSLSSLAHGNIMTLDQIWNQEFDAILQPDVYTLRFDLSAGTVPDPFGDSQGVDYNLNLAFFRSPSLVVGAVPEPGTSIALLGLALLGVTAYRRPKTPVAVR